MNAINLTEPELKSIKIKTNDGLKTVTAHCLSGLAIMIPNALDDDHYTIICESEMVSLIFHRYHELDSAISALHELLPLCNWQTLKHLPSNLVLRAFEIAIKNDACAAALAMGLIDLTNKRTQRSKHP
jgi:hypothetical protein